MFQEANLRMQYTRYKNPVYLAENPNKLETSLLPHFFLSKGGIDLFVTPFLGKLWGDARKSADFDLYELSLLKKWDNIAVTLGRKPLSFEDGSFIGVTPSLYKPKSYDMAMVELFEKLSLFFILDQIDTQVHGHDVELETYGFYFKDLYSFNLFGYYYVDNTKDTMFAHIKTENNFLFGFSESFENSLVKWRVGVQGFSAPPYHGTLKNTIDVMGHFNIEHDFSLFNLDAGAFYAGPFYKNRYQNQDSFGGRLRLFGRTNLMGVALNIKKKYDLFDIGGGLYSYWRSNRNATLHYANGSKMDYNHSTTKRFVGNELNVNVAYDMSSTFKVKLESSLLFPGDYLKIQIQENKKMYKTQIFVEGTL